MFARVKQLSSSHHHRLARKGARASRSGSSGALDQESSGKEPLQEENGDNLHFDNLDEYVDDEDDDNDNFNNNNNNNNSNDNDQNAVRMTPLGASRLSNSNLNSISIGNNIGGNDNSNNNNDNDINPGTTAQRERREIRHLLKGTTLRGKIFVLLEEPNSSMLAYCLHVYFLVLVVAGTFTFCMETVTPLIRSLADQEKWFAVDTFIMISWTVEFLLRLWCSPRYVRSWFLFVDFIAILPYYLTLSIAELRNIDPNDPTLTTMPAVRLIKLLRVLRLLKFARTSERIMLLFKAIRRSTDGIVTLLYVMSLATVMFSACMFYAEISISTYNADTATWYYSDGKNAGQESPFQSILDAFYWCVVTMTTVGYGDAYPSSTWGKLVAAVTMISSMLILAFPATIIGANLTEVYQEFRDEKMAEMVRLQRKREKQLESTLDPNHGIDNKVIDALNRTKELISESSRLAETSLPDELPDVIVPNPGSSLEVVLEAARLAADVCEREVLASKRKVEQLETRVTQLCTIIAMMEISVHGGVGGVGLGGAIRSNKAKPSSASKNDFNSVELLGAGISDENGSLPTATVSAPSAHVVFDSEASASEAPLQVVSVVQEDDTRPLLM